jgi:hypothetical protein
MDIMISDTEVRVLGCVLEKEMATPEYYPLSLNALVNACNQKSNRYPVVSYDEKTVAKSLDVLKEKQLVWQSNLSRVPKYEERFLKNCNFVNREASVLCVLMLRGPQTTGEIRGRTERLYEFKNLEEVNETLSDLEELGYIKKLERQPGRKESRYAHLLSGMPENLPEEMTPRPEPVTRDGHTENERLSKLEEDVKDLGRQLDELKNVFFGFKKQFE